MKTITILMMVLFVGCASNLRKPSQNNNEVTSVSKAQLAELLSRNVQSRK